jgi:hypothetical protein
MTNAVSFITDMVSILELSSNRVPHQKLRKFAQGGGEFCSRMSSYLSADDLEVLANTIDTIGCSESFLCGEKGVKVCRKLLHIIEVLLRRISILESEKNEIELFLEDILTNMSIREEMDDSEITMELIIQQNKFLQDELANLKCATSKLEEDLNSEKTKTRDFEWLQQQNTELFDELISRSTDTCDFTSSFECRLFKFAKCESFLNKSESINFDPNTATNCLEDFETTLKDVSPVWKEARVLEDKDSLLWLVIVISSSAVLNEEFHRVRQRFPKIRFVLRDENYQDNDDRFQHVKEYTNTKSSFVDYMGNKMWMFSGVNNDINVLLRFVEHNTHLECFVMQEVCTTKIGVALIIPDGAFDIDINIDTFIKSAQHLNLNLWIREQSFYEEDYRFYNDIPLESLQCPFNEDNKVANKSVYSVANKLPYEITKGCVGVCCGPHFENNMWTEHIAVWVFSLFDGLVPALLMEKFCVSKVVSIRASCRNLQNEHLFGIAKPGRPIQSGLRLSLVRNEDIHVQNQSLCSFISIHHLVSNTVQKGYLTTMHSPKLSVSEKDIFMYSSGCIRNERKFDLKPICHFTYDERIKVKKDGCEYVIGADFCIATCSDACTTQVYHKDEELPLVDIVDIKKLENCALGRVFKSGQTTGTQAAVHINSMICFENEGKIAERTMVDVPTNFIDGLAEVFNKHFIIVYSPTLTHQPFMAGGDSGGLCYTFIDDSIYGVGICIGKLSGNFYKIIPLSLIETCYESRGYRVKWIE